MHGCCKQAAALPYHRTGATGRTAAITRMVTDIGWVAAGEPAPDPDNLGATGAGPSLADEPAGGTLRQARLAIGAAARVARSHLTPQSVWFRNSLAATAPGHQSELRLRVAIAWAELHLEVLRSFQPRVAEAAATLTTR